MKYLIYLFFFYSTAIFALPAATVTTVAQQNITVEKIPKKQKSPLQKMNRISNWSMFFGLLSMVSSYFIGAQILQIHYFTYSPFVGIFLLTILLAGITFILFSSINIGKRAANRREKKIKRKLLLAKIMTGITAASLLFFVGYLAEYLLILF
jgi:heme/copper-type cytochrome/quinol oxidase subunit 1